jgi:epsin
VEVNLQSTLFPLICQVVSYSLQALQLLEYIIKHGSERVVDDARSHLSTLKMLRNFHYIDEKGKDQGINGQSVKFTTRLALNRSLTVRNRAKEIAEMLSDLDRVRQERRKAKMNKNKYTGTGNDPMGFGSGGSMNIFFSIATRVLQFIGRYGGFSSDDYYGSSGGGGSYSGGGGGYSGSKFCLRRPSMN